MVGQAVAAVLLTIQLMVQSAISVSPANGFTKLEAITLNRYD